MVKGTEHADNALRDGLVEVGLADQGLLLIVTWLAVKFGEDEAVLAARLSR